MTLHAQAWKQPLIAIWSTRVNHLFPLPVAQPRSGQPMIGCAVAQSSGKLLGSFTCYKGEGGGWDTPHSVLDRRSRPVVLNVEDMAAHSGLMSTFLRPTMSYFQSNMESLAAHQESARAHLRAATHRLRNTGLDDTTLLPQSRRTCALRLNLHEPSHSLNSLESTPSDCPKLCDTVYKPLLSVLICCTLLGPIKIKQHLTVFTLFPRHLSLP